MIRVRQLSGLGAASSDELIDLLDSIPLVDKAQATRLVRSLELAVADAADERVSPKVESAVKKGVVLSVGLSVAIGIFVLRRAAG